MMMASVEIFEPLIQLARAAKTEVAVGLVLALQILAALSVPSVLLRRRGRPTSAIAWLLVLFSLPGLGVLAWWIFGRTRIERRLRAHSGNKQNVVEHIGVPRTMRGTRFESLLPGRAGGEYAFSTEGNRASLLLSGKDAFASLEQAIDSASECVHLAFYIFEIDDTGERIIRRLIEARRRGVRVRLLLDGFGSRHTANRLKKRLEPEGVQVGVFFPARFWPLTPRLNFVNHRKIVTVDNRLAFTGGMNIGVDYEHDWQDLMVRIEGPAVEGLNHIFLEDWFFATRELLSDPHASEPLSGPEICEAGVVSSGPDTEDWIHDAYFLAITQARERIFIATPYFIPSSALLTALRTASGRGVDVRIVLPSLSDVRLVKWASRSFYGALVSAGVRIFEYSRAMLHAKAFVIDDEVVSVGTANLDNRSLRLNFEVSCFVASERINRDLTSWFEALFVDSEEISFDQLDSKPTGRKLLESAAHLCSPLL